MHRVEARVITCMGKTHYLPKSYAYSKHYGDNDDLILLTKADEDNAIVSNREISTLLESESVCAIELTCTDCREEGIHNEWRFTGLSVNEDNSISYDESSLTLTRVSE